MDTRRTGCVGDPRLQLDELTHVQEEVALMLGGGPEKESDQESEDENDEPVEPKPGSR